MKDEQVIGKIDWSKAEKCATTDNVCGGQKHCKGMEYTPGNVYCRKCVDEYVENCRND